MSGRKSHTVAFCGVLGALMVTLMLMGNLLAVATFTAPLFAGLLLVPVLYEKGNKMSWVLYLAVSLLCLMLVSDMEMSFTFIFIAGPYPMIQLWLNMIKQKGIRVPVKAVYFNIMLVAMYSILIKVFPIAGDFGELGGSQSAAIWLLIALGNFVFVFYDLLVNRFTLLYVLRLRKRLKQFL